MSDDEASNLFSKPPGSNNGAGDTGDPFVRKAESTGRMRYGVSGAASDPRMLGFIKDMPGALLGASKMKLSIEKADRMTLPDAMAKFRDILEMYQLTNAEESVQVAVFRAICLCHTFNSSSVLQPERSRFWIDGDVFLYSKVMDLLGNDARRYFRAIADRVADYNQQLLEDPDYNDPDKNEQRKWIKQVAESRGISRFPKYAHDSADACLNTDPASASAIAFSKRYVLESNVNVADNRLANSRVAGRSNIDALPLEAGISNPDKSDNRRGSGQ